MLVIAVVVAVTVSVAPATPAEAAPSEAEIRDRLEYLINRARARHGLRRLTVDLTVQRYAKGHAKLMASSGTIFHDPALGLEVLVGATAWGENVGYTSQAKPAKTLHSMFMNSTLHRANVLRARWTHMGIGIERRNGRVYAVQRFADAT